MENTLRINGVIEKIRFINELVTEYGEEMSIGELQTEFFIKQSSIPVEKCKFTGIRLSQKREFTGTIKEIIDGYDMSKEELHNPEILEWLIKLFTEGYKWLPDIQGKKPVKCVPIDRFLSKDEVSSYIKTLV